jgi:hypothetical protein
MQLTFGSYFAAKLRVLKKKQRQIFCVGGMARIGTSYSFPISWQEGGEVRGHKNKEVFKGVVGKCFFIKLSAFLFKDPFKKDLGDALRIWGRTSSMQKYWKRTTGQGRWYGSRSMAGDFIRAQAIACIIAASITMW